MNIGIITFHRAHNYGALLQCYALKRFLELEGHVVNVVDYWPLYHSKTYNLLPDFSSKSFKSKLKTLLLFIIGFYKISKRANGYKRFIRNYLELSNNASFIMDRDLRDITFDAVVYGSDQIWWKSALPGFKGLDLVYWGDYMPLVKNKIAYAPSMGVMNFDNKDVDILRSKLANFKAISVRENIVKEFLKDRCNINADVVLDPVFLLNAKQWESMCTVSQPPVNINEKYVFFYQLVKNEAACKLVDKVADVYGYKVIEIRGRVDSLKFGDRYLQTLDPIGFIQLIKHAQFVVTTSFHGTAFSIIFEKQFFATGMGENSERARSLLRNLGIENCYVDNPESILYEGIDYKQINEKLNALIAISKGFLVDNL